MSLQEYRCDSFISASWHHQLLRNNVRRIRNFVRRSSLCVKTKAKAFWVETFKLAEVENKVFTGAASQNCYYCIISQGSGWGFQIHNQPMIWNL